MLLQFLFFFFLHSQVGVFALSSPTANNDDHKIRRRPRIPVLNYNDDWVCVDKPCGLTVHRSRGTPKHKPVLTTAVKRQLARKVFPVHRLDHRTSGAILLAFDSVTAGQLHDSAIRKGEKKYIALLRGEWKYPEPTQVVDKPLRIDDTIKEAKTRFKLLATVGGEIAPASLVLCEPLTGRTHQIRRHAFAMGHPIIGDTAHGDSRVNRWWRENLGLDRLALHCWILDFEFREEKFQCNAPLPLQLQKILQATQLWETAIEKEPLLTREPFDVRGGTFGRHYRQKIATLDDDSLDQ